MNTKIGFLGGLMMVVALLAGCAGEEASEPEVNDDNVQSVQQASRATSVRATITDLPAVEPQGAKFTDLTGGDW